jgi:choline dehydrogenase-like flavoprotein
MLIMAANRSIASMMYDFIVIGSGSAGGILSRQLNRSGARTVLLEAGKFYRKNNFPKSEIAFSAQLFWGGGIEFDSQARTAFLRAKCVGGTTIVNQCLMDRFDDDAVSDWKQRSGVGFFNMDEMTSLYDKAEGHLSLNTFAERATAIAMQRNSARAWTSLATNGNTCAEVWATAPWSAEMTVLAAWVAVSATRSKVRSSPVFSLRRRRGWKSDRSSRWAASCITQTTCRSSARRKERKPN